MKRVTKYITALALLAITVTSCNQVENESVNAMLNNPVTQNEIMTAISGNHQMMGNMMDHIMQNKHAMQMMQMNKDMMQGMMEGDQTMNMMKNNPELMTAMMNMMMGIADADSSVRNQMSGMMMDHPKMMNMMMGMMNEKGMMDNNSMMRGPQMMQGSMGNNSMHQH